LLLIFFLIANERKDTEKLNRFGSILLLDFEESFLNGGECQKIVVNLDYGISLGVHSLTFVKH
jgi:hypothetical protein